MAGATSKEQYLTDTKWQQNAITVAGGNRRGNQLNQFSNAQSICIDDDHRTIYVADYTNHRTVEWKLNATNGQIVAGGNGKGNQLNQLNYPTNVIIDKENNCLIISDCENRRVITWSRHNNTQHGEVIISDIHCHGLAIDKNNDLYVCDSENNEVKRWKKGELQGTIVAGGNGLGNQLNQFEYPTHIFVDNDLSLYVSDLYNHRVMKWTKDATEGIVVASRNGEGNSLTQLSYPYGITVDHLGYIYIADSGNNRIMRWYEGDKEGSIIVGGNGKGTESNQLDYPNDLSFDQQGNLYVLDYQHDRIQKFEIV